MKNCLSKEEQMEIRKRLFLHLDGWAVIPTIYVLDKIGALKILIDKRELGFNKLNSMLNTNSGYLNIALRILSSQGYLRREIDNDMDRIYLKITNLGEQAFRQVHYYETFFNLIKNFIVRPKNMISNTLNIEHLRKAYNEIKYLHVNESNLLIKRIMNHMEGIILGPLMVGLGMNNKLKKIEVNSLLSQKSLDIPKKTYELMIEIFQNLKFISKQNSKVLINERGVFYLKKASAYGVTVSYLPTFAKLNTLLTGDPNLIWEKTEKGDESHVYRYMNVWGSGGAHNTYFKKVDEIIIEIFNKPINEQPKGFIDIGCGDGSFIKHIYNVIKEKTLRGTFLSKFPIQIVGVDFNKKARLTSIKKMNSEKIKAKIVFGDISDPHKLNKMLFDRYQIKLVDLLNTRTFLDHNRIYKRPVKTLLKTNSEGAFAFRGRRIPNNELFQNLNNHLLSWAPFVRKFGLLIVELHTINSKNAASNIGGTLATPYDATHGYTDQYIIEYESFINAAKQAGLSPVPKFTFKFPNNGQTTVSIQLLKTT